ncbi:MAG: histone deacetylase [Bryobacteraceae bacterium]
MSPFPLIYHDLYDLNLGDHVFQARKYPMLRDYLLRTKFAVESDFVAPTQATQEQAAAAHDPGWVKRLATGTLSYFEILKLEIPYSRKTVEAFFYATGGSILTVRLAVERRVAFNIGGGFHHAFAGHGEGFCALNDIAVAIRVAQREGLIQRAMVVDVDVHHGNGTAAIFAGDPTVFTLSIHQRDNYPAEKPPSTLDIHLDDGVGDEEYLTRLREALIPALERFKPELVFYVAGADPYQLDQLGGLNLTIKGLHDRDRLSIGSSLDAGAAVAITLAGGYAFDAGDTVVIHANTALAASEALTAGA